MEKKIEEMNRMIQHLSVAAGQQRGRSSQADSRISSFQCFTLDSLAILARAVRYSFEVQSGWKPPSTAFSNKMDDLFTECRRGRFRLDSSESERSFGDVFPPTPCLSSSNDDSSDEESEGECSGGGSSCPSLESIPLVLPDGVSTFLNGIPVGSFISPVDFSAGWDIRNPEGFEGYHCPFIPISIQEFDGSEVPSKFADDAGTVESGEEADDEGSGGGSTDITGLD
jgi:hypothetical protein